MDKWLKKAVKFRSQGNCEKCGTGVAEHIHHLTYANVPDEHLEDLQHICLKCHREYHPHHKFLSMREQYAIAARRRKLRIQNPQIGWLSDVKRAEKELRAASRFNKLPMSRRRGQ